MCSLSSARARGAGGGVHAPWGIFWIKIRGSTTPYPWTNTPLFCPVVAKRLDKT